MPVKEAQRRARDKYDTANMTYQTVKVKRQLLDDFKAACARRGDRVNTVLRQAMENYVNETPTVNAADDAGENDAQKRP